MWGSEEREQKYGVTLRAIHELFNLVDEEESRGSMRLSEQGNLYFNLFEFLKNDYTIFAFSCFACLKILTCAAYEISLNDAL